MSPQAFSAPLKLAALAASLATFAACAGIVEAGRGPVASPADTVGPNPVIKPVDKSLLPTMQIAPAKGWATGEKPAAAAGLAVNAYATGLDHPRWLYVLPNGDVLVAETNAPPKPDDSKGIKGAVQKKVQAKAGAGVQTPNRITLLRDADGDGVAETKTVFIQGLNSPFGMALVGNELYVADTDAIVRFPYTPGATSITEKGQKLTDLPAGNINHHWTKNIIASADGSKLYATVGSNSNVAENGLAAEEGRAAIWEVDRASGSKRVFATGLRNPNGMAWQGSTLWTVANERDELGNDLVPDYLTSVKQDGFYGWPFSYYGQHVDDRVKPQSPDKVAKAIAPDYALGAHVAALGLAAADKTALPAPFAGGMFIGEHGSWNRKPPVGYKVAFVPFANGKPAGPPVDVLTGFVDNQGDAHGRPVGVVIDSKGALLVADDVGNVVWRTSAAR
ncbi:MAG TPA: sorbosone dehydrogenase family protein [Ideonella sp.]|uniref:PQQ-dependent sugar dehydrogenase n=1 Tax=Ideonella sp. TaxID=1929293 RepID=UPI002C573936|nr:sorbosone dehydrogenase family protein [Ideonella sp.]HSI47746.1 sorbosone dehydrogenase family protein [Ideonella sp.]